jgi:hypothetical protein
MNTSAILETERFDEEVLSPEDYLNLTEKQRRDIAKVTPLVRQLGSGRPDVPFAALRVRWKTPRYEVRF